MKETENFQLSKMEPNDVAAAYTELRTRVIDLLRSQASESADIIVPHCPQWTVRETLSHLVGVAEDILHGNLKGVTTDTWTQAQILRHSEHSLLELLDIWESLGTGIDAIVPHIPEPANHQFVFDAVTHEHDIRAAVGLEGEQNSLAIRVAHIFIKNVVVEREEADALDAMNRDVSTFDFVRTLSGRRTSDQIAASALSITIVQAILSRTPFSIPTAHAGE